MRGENTFVGLEKMRIGHRRDDVADDPEVAANGIVLRAVSYTHLTLPTSDLV